MKPLVFILFLILNLFMAAQDNLYLLDGSKKVVKILEVGLESVVYSELSESGAPFVNSKISLSRKEILLIEYKNKEVEIFNRPEKNSVSAAQGLVSKSVKKEDDQIMSSNLIYINTLALCNADIAGFYEHILTNKKVGLGIIGAYNFNQYATLSNLFIVPLANAKKNYDLGGFVNFYPSGFKKKVTFSFGLLLKYTAFSFSKNTGTTSLIVYEPANGSQLATIATIGTHSFLSKFLVLRTSVGLGGFNMRGDYKTEYNAIINSANTTGQSVSYTFLPKLYVGINLGFYL